MTKYVSTFKYLLTSARNTSSAVCVAPPEDQQLMFETLRHLTLNKLNKKCITLVSLYRYTYTRTMMNGQQNKLAI
jgi:hypothetical protein